MKGFSKYLLIPGFFCCLQLLLPVMSIGQVVPAPVITCVTTDESSGDVTIIWQNPTPDACGPFVAYVLMGGTSITGPFLTIDTIRNVNQTTHVHTGANGTILDWYYFITMIQNCPGSTQTFSDTIKEETLFSPDLDYVTVTPGGVEINWFPSPSLQTSGYIIYYDLGGGQGQVVDTILNRTTVSYLDTAANPDAGSIRYIMATINSCIPPSRSAFTDSAHNTVFLNAVISQCDQQVALNWNEYINWNPGVSGYRLETSVDGAPFITDTIFPSTARAHTYDLNDATSDTLCFRIIALHQDGTTSSLSNTRCVPLNLVRSTTFNYLRRVSVNPSGTVDLEWYIDTFADINSYAIRRSQDGGSFEQIDSFAITNPPFTNYYTDTQALTSEQSYYYQVTSYDDCTYSRNSTTGRTILLTGDNNTVINTLNWNAFSLEHATVNDYIIYRIENGALVPVQTVNGSTLTFEDDITSAISENGSFCYVIQANYTLDLPGFGTENYSSTSNQFCVYQTPVIYVPNAFVPGGKNNFFKPILLNPNVAEYELLIFDRWGKQLFSTNLLNAGWDGTNNGEKLPAGGYSYYIKVVSMGNEVQEKTGMVVLVR